MKKVYCKNCKWDFSELGCRRTPVIKGETIISKLRLNSTGKCKFYKRKWWKFWIK